MADIRIASSPREGAEDEACGEDELKRVRQCAGTWGGDNGGGTALMYSTLCVNALTVA